MRIWRLYLENYIGIFNGMGLTQIWIDFDKCKNNIVVIKGDNGSGKSTLFKALNPFPDSTSSFIPGKTATKNIEYILPDGTILDITYTHTFSPSGARKTTCEVHSINPDGISIDLNPTKNVNEGKDIICDMLDIDTGFLTLAQLSSDDRGLADKTPTERKKFINNKISELDAFNEIYKKLTKKYSELNSMVKSISAKLDSIGDINTVKNDILSLTNKMGLLEDHKVELIADISALQVEYDSYQKDTQEFARIKGDIDGIEKDIESLGEVKEITDDQVLTVALQVNSAMKELSLIRTTLDSKNKELGELAAELDKKELKLQSINVENLEEIDSRINSIKSNIATLEALFDSLGFKDYKGMTPEEYNFIIDTIGELQELGDKIFSSSDSTEELRYARDVVLGNAKDYSLTFQKITQEIMKATNQLNEQKRLSEYLQCKEDFILHYYQCDKYKYCPLYKYIENKLGKYSEVTLRDLEDLAYKLEDLKSKRDTYEEQINLRNRTSKTVDMLREYLHKYRASIKMIKKFPIGPAADMSEAELTWNIISGFGLSIDLTPYREAKNLFEEVSAHRNDIAELEKLRASIAPNAQLKEQLEEDLRSLKEKYDKKNKEIKHLSAREQILDSDLIKMNEYKNTMEADLDKYQRFCSLTQTRDVAKEELAKYNDSWVKAKDIEMQIEVKKNRLDAIVSKEIADIQKQINDANAKLVMYNEYVKEYALCSKEFNKIGVIRKYCSPTTGIQTIFMEMYMNKVIGISNQLLSMLFNGEYVLQPFVVNENEFRMPVLGSGILNDDISSMSTSQICMISMILSFALMRQSSTIYNIIKIDELEGGLDSQNRLAFFDVLNNLMMTLQCEQCVMISHNAELNMKTMDVIVLKNSDPSSSYYEGNVIYDYNGRV